MDKGIIYLIQPAELIGTNRYKVGMSNKLNLDRCKTGYLKGYIQVYEKLIFLDNLYRNYQKKNEY